MKLSFNSYAQRMITYRELGKAGEEAIVAYFRAKTVVTYIPGRTDGVHRQPHAAGFN